MSYEIRPFWSEFRLWDRGGKVLAAVSVPLKMGRPGEWWVEGRGVRIDNPTREAWDVAAVTFIAPSGLEMDIPGVAPLVLAPKDYVLLQAKDSPVFKAHG